MTDLSILQCMEAAFFSAWSLITRRARVIDFINKSEGDAAVVQSRTANAQDLAFGVDRNAGETKHLLAVGRQQDMRTIALE
jgi:hypothetical protein